MADYLYFIIKKVAVEIIIGLDTELFIIKTDTSSISKIDRNSMYTEIFLVE